MQLEDVDPLIVTLRLDAESSQFFDSERQQHFPPERNVLAAHVTLFHKLPGEREPDVCRILGEAAARTAAFPVAVTGLRSLGRGVAYELASDRLAELRAALAKRFGTLSPQDAQGFRPHVTVQNKVTPDQARALLARLRAAFWPRTAQAVGIDLWAYRGGPWAERGAFRFAERPAQA
jgi:2'-5' RNA ligase